MFDTWLSIGIPAYNAEGRLGRCLESIVGQDMEGVEVVVVDDGSTDATLEVAEDYACGYDNVRVIRQENGGAGVARNTAIANARGKWIAFVDSDDMLLPDAIDVMKRYADSDLNAITFYQKKGTKPTDTITVNDDIDNVLRNIHDDYPQQVTPWNKMLRREWLTGNGITFPKLRRSEDFIFTLRWLNRTNAVGHVNRDIYYYQYSGDGLTWSYNPRKLDIIDEYMGAFREEMPRLDHLSRPRLNDTYLTQAYDQIYNSLHQIAYHERCSWGRKRRIEFLRTLLDRPWAQEALVRKDLIMERLQLEELHQLAMVGDVDAIDKIYIKIRRNRKRSVVVDRLIRIPGLRQLILFVHNHR